MTHPIPCPSKAGWQYGAWPQLCALAALGPTVALVKPAQRAIRDSTRCLLQLAMTHRGCGKACGAGEMAAISRACRGRHRLLLTTSRRAYKSNVILCAKPNPQRPGCRATFTTKSAAERRSQQASGGGDNRICRHLRAASHPTPRLAVGPRSPRMRVTAVTADAGARRLRLSRQGRNPRVEITAPWGEARRLLTCTGRLSRARVGGGVCACASQEDREQRAARGHRALARRRPMGSITHFLQAAAGFTSARQPR
jgi:hypothetical protein